MAQKLSLARRRLAAVPRPDSQQESRVVSLAVASPPIPESDAKIFFIERDGLAYAGTHVLADFWGASNLDDPATMETALREAVDAVGATLLSVHVHHFSPNGGVSAVAVLAESHISVHTWPERGYAAFDVFTCGSCNPHNAIPVLKRAFQPKFVQLNEQKRGIVG